MGKIQVKRFPQKGYKASLDNITFFLAGLLLKEIQVIKLWFFNNNQILS